MARIRSIKPEALQHRKVGRLSDRAFRLWVGMLTQADDEGRLVVDPENFRVLFFGYHPKVKTEQVLSVIDEIAGLGLVRLYRINSTSYADFPSWKDHQIVNRPSPSFLPPYDEACAVHVTITEHSLNNQWGSDLTLPDRPDRSDLINPPVLPPSTQVIIPALVHREDFEQFWTAYPRKVGKGYAQTCFLRAIRKTTVAVILDAIEKHRSYPQWTRDGGQYIPNPSTWLNQERWNDEPVKQRGGLSPKTQRNIQASADFLAAKKDKPW